MNKYRWEQWLWTCVYALLPLLLWFVVVQVIGVEGDTGAVEASRELLFSCLAICTLGLFELRNSDARIRHRMGYETLNSMSVLLIASSGALYGVFLLVQGQHRLLSKIFSVSIGVALLGFILSTSTQVFVRHGESNGLDS